MKASYTYHSTQRPIGPGTCPRDFEEFQNFEFRRVVDGLRSWGTVTYNRELTPEELYQYDLVPVPEESQS